MVGQIVYVNNNVTVNGIEEISLSLEGFETGIYMVTVKGDNTNVTKQLVVSK
ncbi:MAG: T9SS type A sorting domain-containing protein [Bacteroidetes bacterium]|nr:T9SS type A sorting domain-containing protein [Bacteroidota bacterium]